MAADLGRRIFELIRVQKMKMKVQKALIKRVKKLATKISKHNNFFLQKRQRVMDKNHRMLPYLINERLEAKKNQPEFVVKDWVNDLDGDYGKTIDEWVFTQTCQKGSWLPKRQKWTSIKCRYLHHKNSYLKLGPFLEEQISVIPYSVVFHDILNDKEIKYLIDEAKPHLSRIRNFNHIGGATNSHDISSGRHRRVIHKTVQAWISEVEWPNITSVDDIVGENYLNMKHPILWQLNRKISLASQMITNRHGSATSMQVSNYGLGGLCEGHIDPSGIMEQDEEAIKSRQPNLFVHGDMVATFMAWLSETEAGGGTAYLSPGYEGVVMPKRGAAAFWYDLLSDGFREFQSAHGGCPVLKGTKWILNKWIHMYDNFRKFPCQLTRKKRFDAPNLTNYF